MQSIRIGTRGRRAAALAVTAVLLLAGASRQAAAVVVGFDDVPQAGRSNSVFGATEIEINTSFGSLAHGCGDTLAIGAAELAIAVLSGAAELVEVRAKTPNTFTPRGRNPVTGVVVAGESATVTFTHLHYDSHLDRYIGNAHLVAVLLVDHTGDGVPETAVEVGVNVHAEVESAPLDGVVVGIDFGTGQWTTDGPCGATCPGRTASMTCDPEGCGNAACRDIGFEQLSILDSFDATAPHGGALSVQSFDADGLPLEQLDIPSVSPAMCTTHATGWTQPAASVRFCFEHGSDLVLDNLSYTPPQFQVGFSAIETTPIAANGFTGALSGVSLGGYGSSCPLFGIGRRSPTGVNDPLYARALAIESEGTGFVLVMIDAVGAGNRTTDVIATQAAQIIGIPAAHIFVGQSHSHSAPDLVGLWSQLGAVNNAAFRAHRDFVIGKAVTAVVNAWNGRRAAHLFAASGTLNRANNRRGWGFTDPALVVLDATDGSDGSRIGTLVSWSAHPTVLGSGNRLISRDYQGYAVDAIEAVLGAETTVYWNGAFGDASPSAPSGNFAGAQDLGNAVGNATLAAMGTRTVVGSGVHLATASFVQCVTNPTFNLAFTLNCMDYDTAPPPAGCTRAIGSYVAYVRLGEEVQAIIAPGEAVTRLAIGDANLSGVKDELKPSTHHLWLSPSPDFLGYLIPCDEFNNPPPGDDAYEETVSLGVCADTWVADPLRMLIQNDDF